MDHVPSGNFSANGAWLCCAVLAHNLIRWSATLGTPAQLQQRSVARTLRACLISLPGRLVNRAGTFILRAPTRWPWRHWFVRRLRALRALPLQPG